MKERTKTQQDLVKESFKTMYVNLMMNYGQFNSDPDCSIWNLIDLNSIRKAVINGQYQVGKFIWLEEKNRNLSVFDKSKRESIEADIDDWYLTVREMGCKFDYEIDFINRKLISIDIVLTH